LFTVCGEDGNVCIPDALGGCVAGDGGAVRGVEGATGGPDVLCGAGWDESDLSEIELGGAGFTVGAARWYYLISSCTSVESCFWEVSDVTVVLFARGDELSSYWPTGHCTRSGRSRYVLAWGVPVSWLCEASTSG